RCDRWMAYHPQISSLLRTTAQPLALDVGYGASYTTTVEWARWLRTVNPDVRVTGLEINPERVLPPREGVRFELGGFELRGYHPQLVRAFNVLRQYDAHQVPAAWESVCSRLAPGGFFIERTCDELGGRSTSTLLNAQGPQSLTPSWVLLDVHTPEQLAERLPNAPIRRNGPGEPIYDLLQAADQAWAHTAGWAPHGPRVRWREARQLM